MLAISSVAGGRGVELSNGGRCSTSCGSGYIQGQLTGIGNEQTDNTAAGSALHARNHVNRALPQRDASIYSWRPGYLHEECDGNSIRGPVMLGAMQERDRIWQSAVAGLACNQ